MKPSPWSWPVAVVVATHNLAFGVAGEGVLAAVVVAQFFGTGSSPNS